MNFIDLPDTSTPITAENLNSLESVIISPTEPTDRKKVWLQRSHNIFDKAHISAVNGYLNNSGQIYNQSTRGERTFDFMRVKPNQTYTFTLEETTDDTSAGYWFGIGAYSSNSESSFISIPFRDASSTKNVTFETPSGTNYIRISGRYFAGATKLQLVDGSTVLPYEPYVDKKIYTLNDNGVYEEFYDETNKEIYSTSEKRIGTWIDGKPLYRKVVQGTLPNCVTNGTYVYSNINIGSNINMAFIKEGYVLSGTNILPLYFYSSSNMNYGYRIYCQEVTSNNYSIQSANANTSNNGNTYYAVVEYTKTTNTLLSMGNPNAGGEE